MHNFNVKMNKIAVVLIACSTIIIMVSGMNLLSDSYFWRFKYFALQWDYVKEEVNFFQYDKGGILHWLAYREGDKTPQTDIKMEKAISVSVLLYHGIINDSKVKPDDVNTSLEDFRNNMFALKKAGYQTITVEEYRAFIEGKKQLPKKSFMLTFDDGRKDTFYNGDPVMRAVGFTGVMNVITGRSLGPDNAEGVFHLSQNELEKMISSGRWEMASHTQNGHDYEVIAGDGTEGHFLSNKLWLKEANRLETDQEYVKRIKDDLLGAKNDLREKLGINPIAFAYPFGDYGQQSVNFPQSKNVLTSIASSIYPITFIQTGSTEFPENYIGMKSFMVRRINVSSGENASNLPTMLEGMEDKPVEFFDDFSINRGWLPGWGVIDIKNNSMTLSPAGSDDSAKTFLGGSYLWKDYYLQAYARVDGGNAFSIVGRYQDGNNFAACNFHDNRVMLSQRIDGQEKPEVESVWQTNLNDGKDHHVGIAFNGGTASCFLDKNMAVTGQLDKSLQQGGAGFNIWNTMQKSAQLHVKKLMVSKSNITKAVAL